MSNTLTKAQSIKSNGGIIQNIVTTESIDALSSALDVVKKEYGDYKLSKEMRMELAQELDESEECTDGWQTVVDILNHIDINELAKKHPENIGKVSKTVVSIISCIFPSVSFATIVPEDFLAKMVEFAGVLTPEHLVNILAKMQIEKNKARRKQAKTANLEEQPSKVSIIREKLIPSYRNTTDKFSSLFIKASRTPPSPQDEDIFDSIRKLSELKNSGIITQEEFDIKKAELLERV